MSTEEQQEIKYNAYSEAMRYMENAKETLQKARKEDDYYSDSKYVSTACGTAYKGVLIALDTFLALKDVVETKIKSKSKSKNKNNSKRKSIEYYTMHVSKLDKKMLKYLNNAYALLHIAGYYEGATDARAVKAGFEAAYSIIEYIKPEHMPELPPPPRPSLLRRIYSLLFM